MVERCSLVTAPGVFFWMAMGRAGPHWPQRRWVQKSDHGQARETAGTDNALDLMTVLVAGKPLADRTFQALFDNLGAYAYA